MFYVFSNYIFTWELELVGRVFVEAEVLGNVVEGVKIHLVEKDKEPKITWGRKAIPNKKGFFMVECTLHSHLKPSTISPFSLKSLQTPRVSL